MANLMTDAPVDPGKSRVPCTARAVAAITQEANKAKRFADGQGPREPRSMARMSRQILLLFPLLAGALGLAVFGLVPILILALVLFLPAVLPLLVLCVSMLASEKVT